MAIIYPTGDVTKTAADTAGLAVASNDTVIIKDDIEVASLGSGASPGLGGTGVIGANITVAGSVFSGVGTAINLAGVSGKPSNSNDILIADGGLVAGENGIMVAGCMNDIAVDGTVSGQAIGIGLDAMKTAYANSVANSGLITGDTAIRAINGSSLDLLNAGAIVGGQVGVSAFGTYLEMTNTGSIAASIAVSLDDASAYLTNAGTIAGDYAILGASYDTGQQRSMNLVNSGLIEGRSAITLSGDYDGYYTASIYNSGTIHGEVSLDAGNDLYDGAFGTLLGRLRSGDGHDTLIGGGGAEHFEAGSGDDELHGGGDGDTLRGGHGDDEISGGTGDDLIDGGAGADFMDGGAGIDTLSFEDSGGIWLNLATGEVGGFGNDGDVFVNFERFLGSWGADTITGSASADDIGGLMSADQIAGGAGGDNLRGGGGADTVAGEDGADLLRGGADGDLLLGGNGTDTLRGEAGKDVLSGGAGSDLLFGGLGADVFRFDTLADTPNTAAGRDRIGDFSRAQGDLIDLSALDANGALTGNGSFDFIETAGFSGVAGQLRQASLANGDTLLTGDVNGDGAADFAIQLRGAITFVDTDFVL